MRKLTDMLLILLLGSILNGRSDAASVAAFLAALTAAAVLRSYSSARLTAIISAVWLLLSLLCPPFLFLLPVILYDCAAKRLRILCAAAGGCLCYGAAAHALPLSAIAALLCAAAIALLLCHRTEALCAVEKKYIATRDTSAEVTILLTEKNRHLQESQDNEIRLATLRERNRIAREIHDNVGHLLSRSILQTGALQAMSRDDAQKAGLAALSDTLGSAMTTIRRSVHDLHDESVDLHQSLTEAVRPLHEQGLTVQQEFDCSAEVPNRIKFCLISIVKEGVSNILRHSSGDRAAVILREHPAFYQLMIEDNGACGDVRESDGIGLTNIRRRAEDLGGIVQISATERGFHIFISLPKEAAKQ